MAFLNDKDKHKDDVQEFLCEGENVVQSYGLIKDFACLTNKRIIFVNKTFVSKKTAVVSIPYSKIDAISIEKGKALSIMNTVEIIVKGKEYELNFMKNADVLGFYNTLANYICT